MTRFIFLLSVFCLAIFPPCLLEARTEGIVISAVGDIMLAGSAGGLLDKKGYDYPFEEMRAIFANSDISVGNLEAPITNKGKEFVDKRFRFRSPPVVATALKRAGLSMLTLANNHILDYGAEGLQDTLFYLNANGLNYCGAGPTLGAARTPSIVTVDSKRVAFLAYSLTQPVEFFATDNRAGTAPAYASWITADVRAAKRIADYVVVSIHWGKELALRPMSIQTDLAHQVIDAGADLILGHHPHVLQGVERYRHGVIFYSLGNFIFGSRSRSSDKSIVARITLNGGGINEVEIIPINILYRQVRYRPVRLTGREGERVIAHINRISSAMDTKIASNGDRFLVIP